MPISFRSRYDGIWDRYAILIVMTGYGGEKAYAQPLTFKAVEEGAVIEPTITGDPIDGKEFLQAALDHAWEIGLRPRGFSDTTEQVAAIKAHLSDMRALVFEQKPIDKG